MLASGSSGGSAVAIPIDSSAFATIDLNINWDGGQALIYSVEGIRRAPLSLRMREIVQHFGLTLLLLLMGLAFWNDISKHWSTFVDWLKNVTG